MIDLDQQIHNYYEAIIDPVDVDRITEPSRVRSGPMMERRGWVIALGTALVVVLVVGGTLLLLGGSDPPFGDDPSPSTLPPTTVPLTSTTAPENTSTDRSLSERWQQVAVGEPWVDHIVDMEAIPDGGGFVIGAADPWGVYWSPDGIGWSDADPNRQIDPYQSGPSDGPRTGTQQIAATSDRVGVLDRPNTGLWVGDPRDGVWEQILLGTDDLAGDVELLAVTSNGKEMLVLASVTGLVTVEDRTGDSGDEPSPIHSIDQYVVWVVDPNNGTVERHSLPLTAHLGGIDDTVVEWFNGRWVIYLARVVHEEPEGVTEEESLLVSPDGVSWTRTAAPDDWGMSLTSLTVGSTTGVATVCHFGGDSFWYSDDGLNWTQSDTSYLGHHSAYSDELGFVIIYGDEFSRWVRVSEDGRTWRNSEIPNAPLPGVTSLAASGNRVLVAVGLQDDEVPRLWLWISE